MIAGMRFSLRMPTADLGQLSLQLLSVASEFRFDFRRVVFPAQFLVPFENGLVIRHHFLFVLLDVRDSGLNRVRGETKQTG